MKKKLLTILFAVTFLGFSVPAFSMTITAMDNANGLAQALVGSGITISNATYTGENVASGYFTGGSAAGIGIESGVVLTSGSASNLNGTSNTSDAITGNNGLAGTGFLNDLVPGYTTYDATILEFDFVSSGDAAYFNYVFGSEEYNEWVGSSYNDVFGFFLNGTAISDNVALIPGTTTAVAINNVNNTYNSGYYNDNDPGDLSPIPFAFEYDGFTSAFTASMEGLTAGDTYHLTLAIADAGDRILDSGVFLQAGSFNPDPHPVEPVPEPSTILLVGTGLLGIIGFGRKRLNKKA